MTVQEFEKAISMIAEYGQESVSVGIGKKANEANAMLLEIRQELSKYVEK